MEFKATHQSLDLNELVMIKDSVVYRQTDDSLDPDPCGYAWEYNEVNLIPLNN